MIATIIGWARLVVAAVAIFFAMYTLPDIETGVHIITLGIVGFFGVISWVSHFPLWKDDARRLKIDTTNTLPYFQWEVGFANLAFGLAAIAAYALDWGLKAEAAILLAYGIYLLQAAILITYKVLKERPVNIRRLLLGAGASYVICGYLLYFAVEGVK